MLGNGRLEALCFDGEKRLAHIRGKLRKKVWINQGDIILLSLREYQDEKGDVILKYSADEARSLKAYGELPESAKINETDTYVSPIYFSFLSLSLSLSLFRQKFFFFVLVGRREGREGGKGCLRKKEKKKERGGKKIIRGERANAGDVIYTGTDTKG